MTAPTDNRMPGGGTLGNKGRQGLRGGCQGLADATAAYWSARTPHEERAAYLAILLFGGRDGFASGWRAALARWLRLAALRVEGRYN